GGLEVGGRERVEEGEALCDARAQLSHRGFGVLVPGGGLSGQVRGGVLRVIAGGLDLEGERPHVGEQTRGHEVVGVELARLRVLDGLLDDAVQVAEGRGKLLHDTIAVHGAWLYPTLTRTAKARPGGARFEVESHASWPSRPPPPPTHRRLISSVRWWRWNARSRSWCASAGEPPSCARRSRCWRRGRAGWSRRSSASRRHGTQA